jgi:hypothetical protein
VIRRLLVQYRKATSWVATQTKRGARIERVIFVHFPLKVTLKLYTGFCAPINDLLLYKFYNLHAFRKFYTSNITHSKTIFYVIVMPEILHYLAPCLKCIPAHIDIVLIFNGAKKWERDYLTRNTRHKTHKLLTMPGSSLSHGRILNILLHNNRVNFGILDHDLFVLDKQIFNNLQLSDTEIAVGAYEVFNEHAVIRFPRTHFMFFNVDPVRKLMRRYRIGAQQYKRAPKRVQGLLSSICLGPNNFLKPYLRYFDTFNLIMAMAFYENMHVKILQKTENKMLHIGGTSGRNYITNNLRLSYVDMKFIEAFGCESMRRRYKHLIFGMRNSSEAAELFQNNDSLLKFKNHIDAAVSTIGGCCSSNR